MALWSRLRQETVDTAGAVGISLEYHFYLRFSWLRFYFHQARIAAAGLLAEKGTHASDCIGDETGWERCERRRYIWYGHGGQRSAHHAGRREVLVLARCHGATFTHSRRSLQVCGAHTFSWADRLPSNPSRGREAHARPRHQGSGPSLPPVPVATGWMDAAANGDQISLAACGSSGCRTHRSQPLYVMVSRARECLLFVPLALQKFGRLFLTCGCFRAKIRHSRSPVIPPAVERSSLQKQNVLLAT